MNHVRYTCDIMLVSENKEDVQQSIGKAEYENNGLILNSIKTAIGTMIIHKLRDLVRGINVIKGVNLNT